MTSEALTLKDLQLSVTGIDDLGFRVGLPRDWTVVANIRQPHHADPQVIDLLLEITKLTWHMRQYDIEKTGVLMNYLEQSLHAVRYHQQQFLTRLRYIEQSYGPDKVEYGGQQVEFIFNDLPLQSELEAFIIRARTSIDAACQLASELLIRSPKDLRKFITELRKRKSVEFTVRTSILELFEQHKSWFSKLNALRNAIIHQSEFDVFQGVRFSPEDVTPSKIDGNSSGQFAIETWKVLPTFYREFFKIVSGKNDSQAS